jgi:hypothetical protein
MTDEMSETLVPLTPEDICVGILAAAESVPAHLRVEWVAKLRDAIYVAMLELKADGYAS